MNQFTAIASLINTEIETFKSTKTYDTKIIAALALIFLGYKFNGKFKCSRTVNPAYTFYKVWPEFASLFF